MSDGQWQWQQYFQVVLLLHPQGFGPEAKTRGGIIAIRTYIQYIYIYSIHRKNLDLTKVGAQIVSGVVQNARKWVSGGVIKFPVR